MLLESFGVAMNAVVPFLIYLGFGYVAQALGAVKRPFLKELNRMLFRLMFPFVTFYNIYSADLGEMPGRLLLLFTPVSILALIAAALIIVPRVVKENRRRGVVIQAVYRSNVIFFAMPMVSFLYGDSAGPVTAPVITIAVTIYNVSSVIILAMFQPQEDGAGAAGGMARQIAENVLKNPLLQGAVAGLIFLALGISLPGGVDTAIAGFADLATPLALFVLGGTLDFGSLRRNLPCLVPTLAVRLVLVPAVMTGTAYLLGLRTMELFVVLTLFGTPIATASYPMAENMGADGELAGHFVVLSTVASVATLFLWIFLLNYLGLLF